MTDCPFTRTGAACGLAPAILRYSGNMKDAPRCFVVDLSRPLPRCRRPRPHADEQPALMGEAAQNQVPPSANPETMKLLEDLIAAKGGGAGQ
jgi:hypothetical protein